MEILEDNIVQHKVNMLDTLPEGYAPNMELKWGMLEAGLDHKKRRYFMWKSIAAAAVLVLLGAPVFLSVRNNAKTTTVINTTRTVPQMIEVPDRKQQVIETDNHTAQYGPLYTVKPPPKIIPVDRDAQQILPVKDSTKTRQQDPIFTRQPEEQLTIFVPSAKKRKPRFQEVDFMDNSIAQKPADNLTSTSHFAIKLGTGNQTHSENNRSDGSLRLQRSF